MKFFLLTVILIILQVINKCQGLISNSTLVPIDEVKKLKQDQKCENNSDCPKYSECIENLCVYSWFRCIEDGMCINEEIYGSKYYCSQANACETRKDICELYDYGEKECVSRNTCGEYGDKICECSTNDDCLSNVCENNLCQYVGGKKKYTCAFFSNAFYKREKDITCYIENGDKCDKDSECVFGECNDGYCEKISEINGTVLIAIMIIGPLLLVGTALFFVGHICYSVYRRYKESKSKEFVKF